ncbi:MAG TPA: methylmalonyl Co-A mutase-associated GTPase MeaB [Acidobacteriaceae bacterium]
MRTKADEDADVITTGVAQLVERMRAGDIRSLARAVSLVEDDGLLAPQILSRCFSYAGEAIRVGVTGAPGAGKSTLVDQLARNYRAHEATVGVVAVDPTSPFTGGAILGDRIRMQANEHDPGFYMRSMATRGGLGGLARATADVVQVLEASGKQRILIETVGVGQDEVDIVRLADVTVVVLVPGMGDDVQSIKAGIMEIADIFVVNKSDREGADRVEKEVRALQSLASDHESWIPPIVRTVANTGLGIPELIKTIDEFWSWLGKEDRLLRRREGYWRERVTEMIRLEALKRVRKRGLDEDALETIIQQVARKEQDPYQLVPELINRLF